MQRKKATDFPQELLNLFDRYVHGEITRRAFLDAAKKYAIGGLTAIGIWESLRPNYALAEQVPKDDKRLVTGYESPRPRGTPLFAAITSVPRLPEKNTPGYWSSMKIAD
jgi:carboxymethylenebutenolidase